MQPQPPINPLSQEHLQSLNAILQNAPIAIEYAKVCKECEIPTDEYIHQLTETQRKARLIKGRFFPNEP